MSNSCFESMLIVSRESGETISSDFSVLLSGRGVVCAFTTVTRVVRRVGVFVLRSESIEAHIRECKFGDSTFTTTCTTALKRVRHAADELLSGEGF